MHNVSRQERVRPLLRTHIALRVICSVDDGNSVMMAADGEEEDLWWRKTVWRGDLCCSGRFYHWSCSGGVDNGVVRVGQNTQCFLLCLSIT